MPTPAVVRSNGAIYLDFNDGTGSRVPLSDNDPLRASFGLFLPGVTPAATPTDLLTIQGSATTNVRLRQLVVTGTATSATNIIINLIRRSAANTGGTFVAKTMVQRDINDNAQTAVVNLYSANPTGLGTAVGTMDGCRLNLAPAATGSIDRMMFQWSWLNDKAPLLKGVNDFIALNLGGAAWPAGGALDIGLVLSED